MTPDSSHWSAAHRRSILFLLAVFAIAGGISTFSLPVALFPHVDFPRIVVALDAGDRPADQMLIAITQPVEQTVRAVRGVVAVRSMTTRGSAELSVNFRWGADMAGALQLVESAVSHALAQLPKGTTFTVRRMDPAVFPVAGYSLTSTSNSLVALRDLAQYELVPLLSTIDGVGSVDVQGGAKAEYRVDVDPNRLAAYGLDMTTVANALSASNVLGLGRPNRRPLQALSDVVRYALSRHRRHRRDGHQEFDQRRRAGARRCTRLSGYRTTVGEGERRRPRRGVAAGLPTAGRQHGRHRAQRQARARRLSGAAAGRRHVEQMV